MGSASVLVVLLLPPLATTPGGGPVRATSAEGSPGPRSPGRPPPPTLEVVVLPDSVLESMNERFRESNEHWEQVPVRSPSARPQIWMPGSERSTQLEYMGCLQGEVTGDTLRIRGWRPAEDLVRFQFGVDGSCDHVRDLVGTWHTHPYRVEKVGGEPVKQRSLSRFDLRTFRKRDDLAIVAVWDVDSLDVAIRDGKASVVHPAPVRVE